MEINLVRTLEQKLTEEVKNIGEHGQPLTNYYQISLGILALCEQNVQHNSALQALIQAEKNGGFFFDSQFSVDTGAVAVLGLRCALDLPNTQMEDPDIKYTLKKLVKEILQQKQNGTIGNIYSTGLAIQVT
nr:PREDICTED: transcobalamin-1 [Latimeria chalumnae]|eukprot:XP_006011707.1 PREDICTED: transcobalamin-1 [Latimeria chalumnae]